MRKSGDEWVIQNHDDKVLIKSFKNNNSDTIKNDLDIDEIRKNKNYDTFERDLSKRKSNQMNFMCRQKISIHQIVEIM